MKRKIITKKRVLILLSALVLIAISLVAFLHTKFIRSNIKNQLTDYLKNNQGILLEIESLDFNLLKPEFTLENISVKKYPGNSPPILKAKSISLKIPYSIIWGKTPEIKLLEIRDPVINVFTDKNGLSNIPSPPSPTPPPLNPVNESTKIPPFICHLFEISNCKISFTDLQKDYNLDIPSLSLLLKHINNGKHSLSVDTANTGSFTYQNTRFPIDTFSIKSLLDNENIAIDTCKIKSGENLLNFGGSLHDVFEKRLLEDIHLDTTVDLYSLRNFTGHYFNGKIHLSSRLNGPLDNPSAEIKLNSKNLADKNKNPLSIDGNISWKEKKLLIPALNVSWKNNGELLCSGQLHPLQEKKDKSEGNRLNVKLKSVNLELLQPFIDTHIISTASGSIDLAWKELSKKSLNGKAVLNIQPSPSPQTGIIKSFAELLPNTGDATDNAPQDKNKIPLEVELTATAKSGRFNLDLKRLALPGIRGEVNIETGTTPGFTGTTPGLTGGDELSPLSGSFYLKIDSMQSLLPLLKNSAPSLKENLTGTLRIGGMLGGTLQAPSLSANLKAEKLGPQDLTFTVNLDAGLTNPQPPQSLKPSQSLQANLELKELSCASIKTPFDFTGLNATLGLDAPYPLKAQLNLKHIDAGKLLQSLGMGKAGLNGDITGDIDIRGNLEQPDSLLIESRIETARLGSDSFNIENDGPIRITGDANGLNAINMRLKSSGNHLDVSVSGNFPFKSPTATSNPPGLTLSAAADIGLAEKLMDEVSSKGKIVLNATLTGSLSNPRLSAVLRVEDASFAQASMPPLKNLNLHLSADNKSLTLNTLAFNFLENAFNISHPAHIRLTDGNPVLEDFTLTGGENRLHIKGGYAPGTGLDFRVDGSIDNRIIDNMMAEIALYGKNDFSIHLTGTPDKPQISGFIDVRETGFDMRAPDVSLSQLNGRISLEGNAIKFDKLEGNLNDGSLRIGGQFDLFGSPSRKGSISLEVANAKFHFPEGMKSKISTTLYFKPDTDGKSFLLEGNIDLLQGVYEDIPFKLSESYLSLHPVIPDSDIFDKESLTDRLNLNIHLATKTPIWVDKDLAKSEVSFNLTLTGTASHPGITGRCSIKKGGELYFSNRSFFIDKGVVRFNNPEAIEPEIELTALVNIADYDITLKLNGTPENLLPQLSSLPALPEPDIISLLLNGQIKKNIPDQKFDAEAKALTLAGELATGIAKKKIQEFSGIDKVAIDTSLENKEARLTLSDHLTRHIELVLSQSLVDTPKRSYILRFSPSRNISLETEKTDENKYGINFNHYFFFNPSRKSTPQPVTPAGIQPVTPAGTKPVTPGGLKKTQSNNKKKLIIENITIQPVTPAGAKPVTPAGAKPVTPAETIPVTKAESSGIASFPEKRILGLMKLTKGKHFDYFQFSRDLETIKKFFHHHQYLEVAIRPQRIEKNGSVRLILHISPGPVLLFKYSGANVPVKLRRSIRSLLVAGHFSRPAFSDALLKLKYYYFNKGYYRAKITLPEPQFYGKLKQIRCSIQKGKRFRKPGIQFSGNHSLNSSSLNSLFKNKPLLYSIFTTPEYAVQSIKHLYFKKGFLKTRAQLLPIRFDSKTGKILVNFAISEGPLFKIGAITFEGNRFLHRDQLLKPINLKTRQTFSPEIYKEAAFKLRDLYSKKGFSKCKVESKVEPTSTKELLAIHFMIKENQQGIVKEIAITGNRLTKKHIILRELAFKKGDTIYYRNLNKTRKNLYNLALFDQVDIVLTPLPGQPTASQKRNPANSKPLNTPFPNTPSPNTITKNYKVEIKLREQKRFRLKYGLQLQSTLQDATPVSYGATAQFSDYNLWGRGHYFNLIMGLSNKERKAIGYLGIPYLLGKRIKNELFADYRFKEEPTFTLETVALGLRQKITPWQYTSVSYGYKLSWNKQVGSQEDAPYSYRVGSTGATFSRDSRDNILDAHSGTYHNYSLTLAHNIFGSQVKYIRFSGHYSYYKQLGPVVYAGAVRLGLIKDYGIALPYGERFFAGGGTSIRGYGQNVVGPVDLSGEPAGGNSLFILNQELRFKFSRFFGAVLFMDLGNITPEISDFALGNLRKSIGIGLRIYTPVVLLRLDWGFKLNRRPDESASTIFFSIGQAF